MRSLYITKYGAPEVLQVREDPDPEPGPGEVRIRVRAAGLNFADVMARMGLYPGAPKAPCVVGYEVAGEVDKLGSGVSGVAAGDRVVALTRFKGQASAVIVPADQARRMPDGMTMEEGAAIPVNYLTAYHMIHGTGVLHPGSRVLVHMAAGGVGIAAIQLFRRVPGVTIFGTASAGKHEFLRQEGVHHPIDYHTTDYEAEVQRLTGGKGLHLVLDPLGGKDFKKGYRLLAPTGRLVLFGASNVVTGSKRNLFKAAREMMRMPRFGAVDLMSKNKAVAGVDLGALWSERDLLSRELEEILSLYRKGEVKPHVGRSFKLEEGADAHRFMQERKNVGKLVLIP